ncbi:hypothetical protein SETIT_9G552600v2 [Setaria italica]|uniref:Poly A polymerase head domain-containing protein n=2 Tax=Setaria italica TaxID=4555 RepID=A0A368SYT7_SETIT|nr:uncharacterized protein LOC101779480 [Setaria italica]RCV46700.1 hypothetical protein SETIT_9G552600v2 [Setaria italica]
MTTPRRRADLSPSPSPSSSSPLLSRLRSAASSLVSRQYSTNKGGNGTGGRSGGGSSSGPRPRRPGFVDPSTWRLFDSRAFGINQDAIPKDALAVLKKLRRQGFEAYLVGGCVRDLLLKRVPKDFDVITTASLQQLKKNVFRRCMIVGKRFPICLLQMRDSVIEVSSFRTVGNHVNKTEKGDCLEELNGYDDRDILRWKNSMRRDFTINGLFFNPMNYKIYDYVNGVRDMRKNKVCTVIPAHISFMEDPARILRGLRIAARLGFQFSSETSNAIHDLSSSIINIDKARLMMEMNYMLSYGAAEPSVRLLGIYGLLDILLPFQAAYLSDQMKDRARYKDLMLMKLLCNLDRLFSADRPCHCSLWLALLVFHTTLVISPQDTLVIKAFAALLYFGSWESAIEFLKEEEEEEEDGAQVSFVPETLGPSQTKLDDLMEQTSHLASLVNASVLTLTSSDALEQSLARFSEPPQFSGVVLASNNDRNRLLKIFGALNSGLTSYDERRWLHKIDYWSLKDGNPAEVRFVLGKVIMDTMSDKSPSESAEDALLFGGSC